MRISDKLYNFLKWVSIVAIPAIVTFLGIVLPALKVSPEVVNTIITIIGATGTLIGALIGVSTVAYNKDKNNEAE